MTTPPHTTLLFVINKKSGHYNVTVESLIQSFFKGKEHFSFSIIFLSEKHSLESLKKEILNFQPDIVVAAGGDGTINLVANCIYDTQIKLGILPIGSANGLARSLDYPHKIEAVLEMLIAGKSMSLSSIWVNNQNCYHLADIGFNAKLIQHFEKKGERGLMAYFKAAFAVFFNHKSTPVAVQINGVSNHYKAVMVVIANATKYGTGFLINPKGTPFDHLFEIIILPKYSLKDLFKMAFQQWQPLSSKTIMLQCNDVIIQSEIPLHFQVDGEFQGKIKTLEASINNRFIQVIVP